MRDLANGRAGLPRVGRPLTLRDGRLFWPLDPRPSEVRVDDIAHSLSLTCRFAGHCREFYSVAQHSLLVAELVERIAPELALQALLHDAAEAYLGDIPRPLKPYVWIEDAETEVNATAGTFDAFEEGLLAVIFEGLDVPDLYDDGIVTHADEVALATEARDLMGDPRWPGLPDPDPRPICPIGPDAAARAFLAAFERLSKADR